MKFENSNRTSPSILCALYFCKVSQFQVTYLRRRNLWEFWFFNWPLESHVTGNHRNDMQNIPGIKYCCLYYFQLHAFKRNNFIAPRIQKIIVQITPPPNIWLSLKQMAFRERRSSVLANEGTLSAPKNSPVVQSHAQSHMANMEANWKNWSCNLRVRMLSVNVLVIVSYTFKCFKFVICSDKHCWRLTLLANSRPM